MKTLIAGLTVIAVLAIGFAAYSHGIGAWGGGNMMGPGFGGHMMGPGYGGGMMRGGTPGYGYDQKFLNETADLRKELHEKKFDYFETLRDPETTSKETAKLEKEINKLQDRINEKSPRTGRVGCW
jgi:hypothetical protein